MKHLIIIFSLLLAMACVNSKENEMNKTPNQNPNSLTGQIVKKEFITKAGKSSGFSEYYLRCSVQDYFIKFCESEITKSDIDNLNLGELDAITVEAKIKEGSWDICEKGDEVMQSRIGHYIVIYKIL